MNARNVLPPGTLLDGKYRIDRLIGAGGFGMTYAALDQDYVEVIGWIGGFYEHMTPAQFWAMEAAIAGVGGVLALLLNKPLMRRLQHQRVDLYSL